jgi:hypothetical protein
VPPNFAAKTTQVLNTSATLCSLLLAHRLCLLQPPTLTDLVAVQMPYHTVQVYDAGTVQADRVVVLLVEMNWTRCIYTPSARIDSGLKSHDFDVDSEFRTKDQ